MKCLPAHKVPTANGNVLHDWHAEIVALRAFNLFLMEEVRILMESGRSNIVTFADSAGQGDCGKRPITIQPGVKIHMYCSEAPCGDASMELVMNRQEDASPWPLPGADNTADKGNCMQGRGHFSEVGVVRRKPGMYFSP